MNDQFEVAVQAVIDGDVEKLKALLAAEPGLVTARSAREHRATLLHYIGANGVEKENQRSPKNAVEICRVLLAAGADPDAVCDVYGGDSSSLPLVVSSIHPHRAGVQADLVRELIRGGANPLGHRNDNNPLHVAVCFGYAASVDALIECGAEIRHVVDAAAAGNVAKLKQWIDEDGTVAPEGAQIGEGVTHNRFAWPPPPGDPKELALVYACRLGRVDVVDFLVERGTDINASPVHGETGLHWAAFYWANSAIPLLLDRGIDPGIRSAEGKTAVDLARDCGNRRAVVLIAADVKE